MIDYISDKEFSYYSKRIAYVLISVVVSIIPILEDFADGDIEAYKSQVIFRFILTTIAMSFVFPLLGKGIMALRKFLRNKFRVSHFELRYITFLLVVFPLLMVGLLTLFYDVFTGDTFCDVRSREDIWLAWVSLLVFTSVAISIEYFWMILEKRKQLEEINSKLLRSNEIAKYNSLMNQLNPHFLFNCLNVLSFLVYKDPRSADQFIEEMGKIYRYILQLNDTHLVPLWKEIDFAKSYMYLQKIRFQKGVEVTMELSEDEKQKFVPPLTLEVLLENAIKHNVVSENNPLKIRVFVDEEYLIVENNFTPREEPFVNSTKVGLKNLKEKYAILGEPAPSFEVEEDKFVARLPLIKSNI
ncbi:sensor histidine kinase [Aureibacter tunicatorum]|uniref:Signal transduction histidine kinase internal region domain-containing protein n=1 Tax=Aureibacter tunicatorum TaxID=866807 RepID=A0AAE4BNW8_9BACT|nr:histidine kinase [Aureibacter tunicatorum]MDR6237294.1 hypothetical protein [Aureibacter tunicatorum]BDD06285.1 hypothetical protein AUTU_37680 [Aureibacter tunicatorum]